MASRASPDDSRRELVLWGAAPSAYRAGHVLGRDPPLLPYLRRAELTSTHERVDLPVRQLELDRDLSQG